LGTCIIRRSKLHRAAKAEGALAALDERARPGKEPTITSRPRRGWWRWPAEGEGVGLPHEVWDGRGFWPAIAREHGRLRGIVLSGAGQGTVCKILDAQEVKPHKVRYYLERRALSFRQDGAGAVANSKVNVLRRRRPRRRRKQEAERGGDGHLL